MTFGPNSNNPRELRAYAHASIASFKSGKTSYKQAFEAVQSGRLTRKGEASGLPRALGNCAVLLIDFTSTRGSSFEFSGTLLPPHLAAEVASYERSSDDIIRMPEVDFNVYPRATFVENSSETAKVAIEGDDQVMVINPAASPHIVLSDFDSNHLF
jgi:hypothetical protein